MQRNKNNYWNLYAKNSEFENYKNEFIKYKSALTPTLYGALINDMVGYKNGTIVHYNNAGGGQSGYAKIATITILSHYANVPIEFKIAQRGRPMVATLNLCFKNQATYDPEILSFLKIGQIEAFLHKTASGVWDLYVTKSELYDWIDIVDLKFGLYNKGWNASEKIKIEWKSEFSSSTPPIITHANYCMTGSYFDGRPTCVGTDGVLEIGRIIDFHETNDSTSDFDARINLSNKKFWFTAPIIPNINNSIELGNASYRWSTIYAVNALNTSDERYKENIEYVDTKRNDEAKGLYEFYKNDFKLATYN